MATTDLAAIADLDVQWGQGYALGRPSEPWVRGPRVAADVCRASLAEALRKLPAERRPIAASDRRLVHLSAGLAGARSREDLEDVLGLIAAELRASKLSLSRWHPEEGVLETLAENDGLIGATRFSIEDYP